MKVTGVKHREPLVIKLVGAPEGAVAERKRATARIASTWGAIRLVPPTATKIRQKRTTQDL